MADEANTRSEPPLVVKVNEAHANVSPPMVALVIPQPLPKPRPGLIEAIIWCAIFLGTQLFSLLLISGFMLAVFALQAPDPQQFLLDQLEGLRSVASKETPASEPHPIPSEIGQALAYGMLGAQIASLGLIVLVVPWRIGADWKRQIGFRRPAGLHVLLVVLVVPGFMLLSGGIQELFQRVTGITQPAASQALNNLFSSFPWFLTFLAVGFGPGFVEEMWCRAFLGRGLSARYGIVIGVALTSSLFGLLHIDPSLVIPIAIMGAYLHFIYLASRSIWISILLHTLNNGIAVLASLMGVEGPLAADPHGLTGVLYFVSFSLVLFASIALWTARARIIPIQRSEKEWKSSTVWKPEYPGISAPPLDSGARLGYAKVSPVALVGTLASFAILVYLLFS
ncbi:MAG TPA: type II CAAX endopeptidase family protein [Gemmata sp.]|nr:type II CAAX endopeptidase family protein [Gemmata sp.]